MHLNILEFLDTLEKEVTARGHLLARVRQEIQTFEDIQVSLAGVSGPHPAERIDNYLQDLKLIEQKVRYSHLALFNLQGKETEPELNKILLRLFKKLNTA